MTQEAEVTILFFYFICPTEQEYFAQAVRLIFLHFSKLALREPIVFHVCPEAHDWLIANPFSNQISLLY